MLQSLLSRIEVIIFSSCCTSIPKNDSLLFKLIILFLIDLLGDSEVTIKLPSNESQFELGS